MKENLPIKKVLSKKVNQEYCWIEKNKVQKPKTSKQENIENFRVKHLPMQKTEDKAFSYQPTT